jgi:hypothetical protein
LIQCGRARLVLLPLNVQPRAFEDFDNGGRDLGPDAVAGDQRDDVQVIFPSLPNRAARAPLSS